jgi:hypothetical protein
MVNEKSLSDVLCTPSYYYKKVVVSGELVQLYEYERPIKYGYAAARPNKPQPKDETQPQVAQLLMRDTKREKRMDSKVRAKREAKRLVHSNMTIGSRPDKRCDLWVTLTYADAERARPWKRDDVIHDVSLFADRFKRLFGHDGLMYALELQDGKHWVDKGVHKPARNALHVHMLVFGAPKVQNAAVSKLWGHGFTYTKWLRGSKEEVFTYANYLSKYIAKDPIADIDQKSYIATHELKRPSVFKEPLRVAKVLRQNAHKFRYGTSWKPIVDRDGNVRNAWRYAEYRTTGLMRPDWAMPDTENGGAKPAASVPLHHAPCDT